MPELQVSYQCLKWRFYSYLMLFFLPLLRIIFLLLVCWCVCQLNGKEVIYFTQKEHILNSKICETSHIVTLVYMKKIN